MDGNWLVIAVDVRTADGRDSSFSAPCLTTEEARDVYRWLRHGKRRRRRRRPRCVDAMRDSFHRAESGVPVARYPIATARLEVAFSDESLPPWPSRSHLAQVYPQVLDVATDDLAAAADQWARELQPFPRRAPD